MGASLLSEPWLYLATLVAVEEVIYERIVELCSAGTSVPMEFKYVLEQTEPADNTGHWAKTERIIENLGLAGKVNPRKVSFGVRTVINADTMEQLCIRMAKLEFKMADYLVAWDTMLGKDDLVSKQKGYREVALKSLADYGVKFDPELS